MKISQPTFARTLDAAYKKVADAIINYRELTMPEAGTAHAVCCSVTSFLAFSPSVGK